MTATATTDYRVAALAAAVDQPRDLPAAHAVLAEPTLREANIPGDARILAINGRAVRTVDAAVRELRRLRPRAALLLRDAGAPFYVAVETPR